MARSLNKAQLIGNLVKDVELKYTPQGTAVCTFSVATNRSWKNAKGEVQEEATFHRVVAWSKLAEICAQLLFKGRKVFVEGHISNRTWEDQQKVRHYVSEIVADDLILLDSKRQAGSVDKASEPTPPEPVVEQSDEALAKKGK
jgi:single-strand DNA-binding protein